jgi:hypothetical protein
MSEAARRALIRAYESQRPQRSERPRRELAIPERARRVVRRIQVDEPHYYPWEQPPRWTSQDKDFVSEAELKCNRQYLYCAPDGRAYRVKLLGLPYMTLFGGIKKYSWIPIDPDCTWGKLEWVYGRCRFKNIPETYPYTKDGWPLTRDNGPPKPMITANQRW